MNDFLLKLACRIFAETTTTTDNTLHPTVPSGLNGTPTSIGSVATNITNLLLYIVGITAVIMIVIGGFQYITSSGDPGKTKTAKDTITFAIIGVVISILAYAIVNFVVTRFK